MARRALVVVALALAACGSDRSQATPGHASSTTIWEPYSCGPMNAPFSMTCVAMAVEYADLMKNANACVAGDTCGTLRPAVSVLDDGGQETITGLCSCPVLVNDSRSASLDAALARFLDAGCAVGCCPCPPSAPSPRECPGPGSAHAGACG